MFPAKENVSSTLFLHKTTKTKANKEKKNNNKNLDNRVLFVLTLKYLIPVCIQKKKIEKKEQ